MIKIRKDFKKPNQRNAFFANFLPTLAIIYNSDYKVIHLMKINKSSFKHKVYKLM